MKPILLFQHANDITLHTDANVLTFWMPHYLMKEYNKAEWMYWRDKSVHIEGQVLTTKNKSEGQSYEGIIFFK